nr:hypothetical protein CFP56_69906 [Quercus suber]
MFDGTIAMGKNAYCTSGEIPKECNEGSRDSTDSKEFVNPQCQPSMNVDPMEVEGPLLSRCKTRTPFASTAAAKVQAIMDMVLTFPGVQLGDCLHMFSTCFFMGNQEARNMFATQHHQKEIQLKWLKMQY